MKTIRYFQLTLSIAILPQLLFSQAHAVKPGARATTAAPKENYIAHAITKQGGGTFGMYKDTLHSTIAKTDAVTPSGKLFQDIHITLDEGDAVCSNLLSGFKGSLALYKTVGGKLQLVKTMNATDKIEGTKCKLLYKATESGSFTLRVTCLTKYSELYEDYLKDYYLTTTIATPASAKYVGDSSFCSKVQFFICHQTTEYLQLMGPAVDTSMDYSDKTKISTINYKPLFNLYNNPQIATAIGLNFDQYYSKYDMMVQYNSQEAAEDYYNRLVNAFKTCLGDKWIVKKSTSFDNGYDFILNDDIYHGITILFDARGHYVHLML